MKEMEMDMMLKELFQDKPIAQEPLQRMSSSIMDQIFAAPVDFQELQSVAKRRKWGFIFLGSVFALSLCFFLVNWLLGPWVSDGLKNIAFWLTANLPLLAWLQERWEWVFDILALFFNIKWGYFLWGQYGLAIMGILFSWVIFEGIRDRLNRKAIKENS